MTTRPLPHAPDPEGLIPVPEGNEAPRGTLVAAAAAFLAVLTGTGLVDLVAPLPAAVLVGDELTEAQQLRREANVWDGSAAKLYELDRRQTSRVRRTVGPWYTLALYEWFREGGEELIVGEDGWLFLTSRVVAPRRRSDEEIARGGAAAVAALERRLAGLGVRGVYAPVPRKAVVEARWLPPGVDPRPGIDREFVNELRRRGLVTADLLHAFERPHEGPLYYPLDSHWTEAAEALAAEEIARVGGFLVREERRTGAIVPRGTRVQYTNLLYLGIELEPSVIERFGLESCPSYAVRDAEGVFVQRSNPPEMTRIALAGTSFSARRNLTRFLAHYAQEPVWNGAAPGTHFAKSAHALLASLPPGAAPPEILVVEAPLHQVISGSERGYGRLASSVASLWADRPPAAWTVVLGGAAVREHARAAAGPMGHLRLPPGVVGGRAAGLLALRVEALAGRGARLGLSSGSDFEALLAWPAGASAVHLPLVFAEDAAPAIRLVASGGLRMRSVEVVADLDPASRVEARLGALEPLEPGREGWRQVLAFDGSPAVEPRSGLVLRLGELDQAPATLEVTARSADSDRPPVQHRFAGLAGGALLALDLVPLEGAPLAEVVVSAPGAPRAQGVTSAFVGRAPRPIPR